MYLNETCSKILIGKSLHDACPIQNDVKQEDALSPLLYNFAVGYVIRSLRYS